jgi:NAD+ synthase (glutamine-hydrolysing)
LVVTPELALMGYLPKDLLISRAFVRRSGDDLSRVARDLDQALVGFQRTPSETGSRSYSASNSCYAGEDIQNVKR